MDIIFVKNGLVDAYREEFIHLWRYTSLNKKQVRVLVPLPREPLNKAVSFLYIEKLKAVGMTKRGSMSIVGVKK